MTAECRSLTLNPVMHSKNQTNLPNHHPQRPHLHLSPHPPDLLPCHHRALTLAHRRHIARLQRRKGRRPHPPDKPRLRPADAMRRPARQHPGRGG